MIHFNQSLAKFATAALDIIPRHYLEQFISLINKRYAAEPPPADFVLDLILRHSPDAAPAINELAPVVLRDELLAAIFKLADTRHPAANKLLACAERLSDPHLAAAVKLFASDFRGELLSEPDLVSTTDTVRAFSGRSRRRLELLLLQAMLKAEHLELAMKLVETSPHLAREGLPPAYLVGILRCILKNEPENYAARRRELGARMTDLDKFRVLELDIAAGCCTGERDHAIYVDQFLRAAPKSVALDFRAKIKPFYDTHDTRLLCARMDNSVAQGIRDDIITAVKERRPLAMIRLGDGESYAYGEEPGSQEEADNALREAHWWGCRLDPGIRAGLQAKLRNAFASADYLGVPSVFRFARDTHYLANNLSGTASARGLVRILGSARPKPGAKLVEDRIHQVIFRKNDLHMLTTLKGSRTVLVSSLRPEIAAGFFPAAALVGIPTHRRTASHPAFDGSAMAPLPFTYETTLAQIRSLVGPGDVVLVAAGIIGKLFIHEAREAGAVALDIGSMLDYLAGAKTRSIADLL